MKNANLPAVQDTTTDDIQDTHDATGKELSKVERDQLLEERFIENLSIYRNPVEAARKAGYSESTALNIRSVKLRNPKFLDRLRQHYKTASTHRILDIGAVEESLLQYLTSLDGETIAAKLPSLRGTLRDIKAAAGVLADEGPEGAKTVNINNIKQLMVQVNNG